MPEPRDPSLSPSEQPSRGSGGPPQGDTASQPDPSPSERARAADGLQFAESSELTAYHPGMPSQPGPPSGILPRDAAPGELERYLETQGYTLLEELGRGGMGVVYKARQRGLNRLCALKLIKSDRLDHPNLKARFQREVQAAARLSHPNIVTVFNTNLDGPVLFLAMEYVPGTNLGRVLHEQGPFHPDFAVRVIKQVAEGLQHAHEQGMVHRDVKPANLMISPWPLPAGKRFTVKILDMGLARSVEGEEAEMGLTQSGELLGTPDFMSPEQAEDPRLVDIRSDLYALGGSMFVLLTGRMMFEATSLVQKLKKHLMEVPPLAHLVRPGIPPELSAVVAKLLEKQPQDRFQTPQELIEALEAIERGTASAVGAPPPASGRHPRPDLPAASSSATAMSSPTPAPAPAPAPAAAPREPQVYIGHHGAIHAVVIAPNGKLVVTGGADESIQVWDAETRRAMKPLPNLGGPVVALGVSPDGRVVASAAARIFEEPNQVDLWDLTTGKAIGRLRGMKSPIQCVAFSSDGKRLAAGAEDGAILVWTLDGKTPTLRLPGHKENVTAIQFMTGDERVLSACKDGGLALWDLTTGAARGAIPGTVGPIRAMAVLGSRIALGGTQLRLRHGDGSFVNFTGLSGTAESLAISPSRRHLLCGGGDGSVQLWPTDSPQPVEKFPPHAGKVLAVAFAPDGRSLFSAGEDGILRRCFPAALTRGT